MSKYICPVCKKSVDSLTELSNCINKHEKEEIEAKKAAKTQELTEKEKKIDETYELLKKLIKEYNDESGSKTIVSTMSKFGADKSNKKLSSAEKDFFDTLNSIEFYKSISSLLGKKYYERKEKF